MPTLRVTVGFIGPRLANAILQALEFQVGVAIGELRIAHFPKLWEGNMPGPAWLVGPPQLLLGAEGAFAPPVTWPTKLPEPTVAFSATAGLWVFGDGVPTPGFPPLRGPIRDRWWGWYLVGLGCLGKHLVQGRAQGGYRTLRPLW